MGTQYGFQCWCGFGIEEDHTKYDIGTCNYPCAGDKGIMCGKSVLG